jgi:hypothetical protein
LGTRRGPDIRFWAIAGHQDVLSPYQLLAANHRTTPIALAMPVMVKELTVAAGILEQTGPVGERAGCGYPTRRPGAGRGSGSH